MSVQMSLEFNMDESRCMINEETTAQKHFTLTCLASRCEQMSLGTADEVIYCNAFAQKEMVLLQYPLVVVNNR